MRPADAALVILLTGTLAADLALPLLLWRAPGAAFRLGVAALAALLAVFGVGAILQGIADPTTALLALLAWLVFAAPAIAVVLASRGSRHLAVALALAGAVGIGVAWLAARRFGAFGWEGPANLVEASLGAAVIAALFAAWVARRPRAAAG